MHFCRYQGLFVPAAGRKVAQYAQVDAWLVERTSQRSIARATGVARLTIAKRLKKSDRSRPCRGYAQKRPSATGGRRWN